MQTKLPLFLIPIATFALLVGCSGTTTQKTDNKISFSNSQTYKFNAASVELIDEYKAPAKSPNVEHKMPISPSAAVKIWVDNKIKASGNDGTVKVVVKEASVKETKLEKKDGLTGFFTKEHDARYDAVLEASVQVFRGDSLFPKADANVKVERSRTTPEDITLSEKDIFFFNLTNDLINDLDREMSKQIGTYLSKELN